MNEELIGSLIDKVDAQERKMEELKVKADVLPSYLDALSEIKIGMEGLKKDVQQISFPKEEMRDLSERLATSIALFEKPVEQKVVHQHHVSKVLWATTAFFLILCLVSCLWYNTYNKLNLYKANDTKYRYLKLEAKGDLSKWLDILDSSYQVDAKMRDAVIEKEEQNQRNLELMQQALRMEEEAKELKRKVSRRK